MFWLKMFNSQHMFWIQHIFEFAELFAAFSKQMCDCSHTRTQTHARAHTHTQTLHIYIYIYTYIHIRVHVLIYKYKQLDNIYTPYSQSVLTRGERIVTVTASMPISNYSRGNLFKDNDEVPLDTASVHLQPSIPEASVSGRTRWRQYINVEE